MNNTELISVIIPVYNVEKYLNQCIESIINQTYKNLEIILIDDGSTDNSGEICENYSKKDPRIKVIHQKNSGVSSARNKGIDIATGKYINFIDSDDYIEEDMIEYLYGLLQQENADISMCSAYDVYDKKIIFTAKKNIYLTMNSHDAYYYMLQPKYFGIGIWNKLIAKELFKSDRFPVGRKNGEELELLQRLIYRAKKLVYSSVPKYYYRQRSDSATHSLILSEGLIESMHTLCEYVGKKFPDLYELIYTNYVLSCFQVYNNYIKNDIKNNRFNRVYKILQDSKEKITYKYLRTSKKVQLFLFYHCNKLWNIIVKTFK